ncbi:MAG: NAD-dependent epimerase/dehydratase family protein, partial [Akkermansiaceae bacterium]
GPTDPCSPYALTKLHGEHWCCLYSRQQGIKVRALRFFSVWGPGQRPDLALESFEQAIEQDQPVKVLGDGNQRRDLTHVSDVVRAIELATGFQGDGFEAFNVGTGVNHSVMDMIAQASSKKGKKPVILHSALHPTDVPETLADTQKSHILLGFQPLHPFQI